MRAALLALAALAACARDEGVAMKPPMAMASGVAVKAIGNAPLIAPLRPMSGDVEVLHGDPEAAGPFVIRIHELPGSVVPPHSHPVDEHITVVQGTWYFGFGEKFDAAALHALPAGGYAFAPKGAWMFGHSPDGAIVQVHGIGPFAIHWHDGAKTLDDADAAATFAFRRGDEVRSPRAAGRIVQGYASGTLVQYEIEAANGEHFMAHQHEVQKR